MNGINDHTQAKHPAHEGINSYGMSCSVSRKQAADAQELRRFAAELMQAVSEACLSRGAKDIGHIKAYLEHDEGFIHANTLGEPTDITVEGRDGSPANFFRLVINAVIFGIAKDAVREAVEESLNAVLDGFSFERQPEGIKIIGSELRGNHG
jgi:hypothetical protein